MATIVIIGVPSHPGREIGIETSQTLVQDSTGTMAYLQIEVPQVLRIMPKLSVKGGFQL